MTAFKAFRSRADEGFKYKVVNKCVPPIAPSPQHHHVMSPVDLPLLKDPFSPVRA